jgi:hypothetical protein
MRELHISRQSLCFAMHLLERLLTSLARWPRLLRQPLLRTAAIILFLLALELWPCHCGLLRPRIGGFRFSCQPLGALLRHQRQEPCVGMRVSGQIVIVGFF